MPGTTTTTTTKWLVTLAACVCFLATSQAVEAGSIRLSTNGGVLILDVNDGSVDDDDPESGVISFNIASFGVFTDIEIDAYTKPDLGSETSPSMRVEVSASSASAGELVVQFSDQGFGPSGTSLHATLFGGSSDDVDYVVWHDEFNSLYGTTNVVAGLTGTGFINLEAFDALPSGAPLYSLTQGVVFNHDANGGQSAVIARLDVTGKSVPDGGSTAALLGSALMALGMVRRRFAKR